jgi:uncharacterized protein (TIGR03437 family)
LSLNRIFLLNIKRAFVLGLLSVCPAVAQVVNDRVLVLVNDAMPAESGTNGQNASVFIGQYYAQQRGIPAANILHLNTATSEFVAGDAYQSSIAAPVQAFLDANNGAMKHKILFIVPTYGVPVKIGFGAIGPAAVDSMLSGIYAPTMGIVLGIRNPYNSATGTRPPHFDSYSALREAAGGWKTFIVSRLDGPSASIAKGLVDKAIAAESSLTKSSGAAYFDYEGNRSPGEWQYQVDEEIRQTSVSSTSLGFNTVLNTQALTLCGAQIAPASSYVYEASGKDVYLSAYGSTAAVSMPVKAVSQGDFTVRFGPFGINNYGNVVYLTLSSSDPASYLKVTYPLIPFQGFQVSDNIVMERFVGGTSTGKVSVNVPNSAGDAENGLSEMKISLRSSGVTLLRNGTAVLSDPAPAPFAISSMTVGTRCTGLHLNGFNITDVGGNVLWNDAFATDTTAKYTWTLNPRQGHDAFFAWGWYGSAYDSYRFVPGGIGAQLTSYTALTIRTPVNADPLYAGVDAVRWSGNWVPRMLEEGVTATWGAVDEPYANLYPTGGDVLDHFTAGYNFGESFSISNPALNWVITTVGDPLYAPKIFRPAGAGAVHTLKVVQNGASYAGGPIAPGEVITLFGDNIGPGALTMLQKNADGTVASQLAGTSVLFDNVAAPLLYVSATQLGAVVPYGVSGKNSVQVSVSVNGELSNSLALNVAGAAPGIFTQDASGSGAGAILNQDSGLNTAAQPADRGSVVSIYATGGGFLIPSLLDGTIVSNVLGKPVGAVTVSIGNEDAEVLYAGAAPGLISGMLQINARVPADLSSGFASVVVRVGGAASQGGVSLAVR